MTFKKILLIRNSLFRLYLNLLQVTGFMVLNYRHRLFSCLEIMYCHLFLIHLASNGHLKYINIFLYIS